MHTHNYEGQNTSHIVMNCVTAGILIFQLATAGVFGLKLFPLGSVALAMAIATPIYRIYLIKRFSKPLKYIPIR